MRWRKLADAGLQPRKDARPESPQLGSQENRSPTMTSQEEARLRSSFVREMQKGKRYYYDPEACSFVELQLSRKERIFKYTAFTLLSLLLASLFTLALDRLFQTPYELALESENETLREHLQSIGDRMRSVQEELAHLSESDQRLYRALLEAEPISNDVRQMGVGGTDAYEEFSAFSGATARLLRESAQTIDQLERQISLQASSYRELTRIADEHKVQLDEVPAILPADGPIVSGYGMRRHPILKIVRPHRGIDILVPTGSSVVAPGDGVVSEVGRGGGLGRFVRISHPTVGYVTTFAHLSEIPAGIMKGRRVKRGDVVGISGNTGLSKAPHLHYEVRDEGGKPYNPVYFFAPTMTPAQYEKLLAESQKGEVSLD